jgi:hypothetical protein
VRAPAKRSATGCTPATRNPVHLDRLRRILALEGIASIGDTYHNTLAEITIGLFKDDAICDDSPFRVGHHRMG